MPARRRPDHRLAAHQLAFLLDHLDRHETDIDLAGIMGARDLAAARAVQLDLDERIGFRERRKHGRQKPADVIVRHPEPHRAGNLRLADRRQRLVVQLQDTARVFRERLSLARERRTPPRSLEQAATDHLLQALDLHAHGGLGPVHLGRSLGEAAGIDHGEQRAQQGDIEGFSHGSLISIYLIHSIKTIRWI